MRNLENLVNSKLALRLSFIERSFEEAILALDDRVLLLEDDMRNIKGPLLDEFKIVKNESAGIVRELERLQGEYRTLIGDYFKTLETRSRGENTEKLIDRLESKDIMIRNHTRKHLKVSS